MDVPKPVLTTNKNHPIMQQYPWPTPNRVLSLLFFLVIFPFTKALTQEADAIIWIPFEWVAQEIDGQLYPRAGMNVRVGIGDLSDTFTMQFDLGANLTMVYGQTFQPYRAAYPELERAVGKIDGYDYLRATNFRLGDYRVTDFDFFYNEDFGAETPATAVGDETVKHVGTIGANLTANKVLLIDYPNQRLALVDRLPAAYATGADFVPAELDRWGRMHVPVTVNGQRQKALFDTGSSLFPLITSSDNWRAATDGTRTDSVLTSTWGESYYTYAADAASVRIGERQLPDVRLFDNPYLSDFIAGEGIWGILGNAHFFDDLVIVDFVERRFGWRSASR